MLSDIIYRSIEIHSYLITTVTITQRHIASLEDSVLAQQRQRFEEIQEYMRSNNNNSGAGSTAQQQNYQHYVAMQAQLGVDARNAQQEAALGGILDGQRSTGRGGGEYAWC